MLRNLILASVLVTGAACTVTDAASPRATAAVPMAAMQPGQRVQLGPMLGERTVRNVMITEGGGGMYSVVYDR